MFCEWSILVQIRVCWMGGLQLYMQSISIKLNWIYISYYYIWSMSIIQIYNIYPCMSLIKIWPERPEQPAGRRWRVLPSAAGEPRVRSLYFNQCVTCCNTRFADYLNHISQIFYLLNLFLCFVLEGDFQIKNYNFTYFPEESYWDKYSYNMCRRK